MINVYYDGTWGRTKPIFFPPQIKLILDQEDLKKYK